MRYLCLVYHEEAGLDGLSAEDKASLDRNALAYNRKLDRSGHLIATEALQSVRTSKSVRRRKRKILVMDGPFAETKEQLCGFVLIEAANEDEAIDIAAALPMAATGTIEIRPIYDIVDPDA